MLKILSPLSRADSGFRKAAFGDKGLLQITYEGNVVMPAAAGQYAQLSLVLPF